MMQSKGVLEYVDYIKQQKDQLEQSENNQHEEEIEHLTMLEKVFNLGARTYFFEPISQYVDEIMKSDLPKQSKLECIAYMINSNRDFFATDSNIETFKIIGQFQTFKEAKFVFEKNKQFYKKFKTIISSNNRIKPLEQINKEDIYLEKLGIPRFVVEMMIKAAIDDYNFSVLNEIKKQKS